MPSRIRSAFSSPYVLLLIPPLLWAGNAVIGRAIVEVLPPLAFSFWRWALALALIAPFGLPSIIANRAAIRRQWIVLLALAITSVAAYNTMLYVALQTSTAVSVTLIAAAMPATIMLLASFWLRERLSLQQWIGMLISLSGVLLVLGRGNPLQLLTLQFHIGDLWAIAANLSWAVYSVMLRRYPTGLDAKTLLTMQILLGLPFIAVLYGFELASGRTLQLNLQSLGAIAYGGVFASIVAYFFWNRGVAAVGPSAAGQYTYFIPVFTAAMALLTLGERVQAFHGASFVLIVSGVALANLRRR